MRTHTTTLQIAAIAAALLSAGSAYAASPPTGLWLDETGRGAVEITECGGALCGHVAWVKNPKEADGCGTQILGDVKPVGTDKWDGGWIYDPDEGSKYDVELTPVGTDKLRVMGYAGTKLLSQTMMWKRAPDGLVKCSKSAGTAAAAPAPEKKADAPASDTPAVKAASEAKPADEAKPATEAKKETTADAKKSSGKKGDDAASMVAQIVDSLADSDAPKAKSSAGSKKTCSTYVPYFEMRVSFPCPN